MPIVERQPVNHKTKRDLEDRLLELDDRVGALDTSLASAREKKAQLMARIKELEEENDKKMRQIEVLGKEKEKLGDANQRMAEHIEGLERERKEELGGFQEDVKAIRGLLGGMRRKIDSLQAKEMGGT